MPTEPALITARTPWFWDTPEGGGWVCYLSDESLIDRYTLAQRTERETDAEQLAEYRRIEAERPKREPTPAERRAWRTIDPREEEDE